MLDRAGLIHAEVPHGETRWSLHQRVVIDTRGLALANVYAAMEAGIARFDASLAGIGGCHCSQLFKSHLPSFSEAASTLRVLRSMAMYYCIQLPKVTIFDRRSTPASSNPPIVKYQNLMQVTRTTADSLSTKERDGPYSHPYRQK